MKRKKKHEDHVDESWLIPYADILTLLLALFIVLFAASEVNSQKFKEISDSFNTELQGGTGILDNQSPIENFEKTSKLAEPNDVEPTDGESTIPTAEVTLTEEELEEIALAGDFKQLGHIEEKIQSYIADNGLSATLETELTSKGLLLKIKDGVLYQPGNANISQESHQIAAEISNLLISDPPRNIYIEGHTDNIPSASSEFPSNWELSSARAINFMKVLLENDQLDPRKFSATGYGEYHPIATNDTAAGRSENRRVEVLISLYSEDE